MHPRIVPYYARTLVLNIIQVASVVSQGGLATAAIFPSSPPSLLPFITVENILPELDIHIIMGLTHPPAKLIPTLHSDLIALHVFPKILSTPAAWV